MERGEAVAFLQRVQQVLGPIAPQVQETPRHYLDALTLFDRCRGLVGAITELARTGFVHEAMVLCRPLYTDSLALGQLGEGDEQSRGDLLIGLQLASFASLEGAMREGERQGRDVTDALTALQRGRASLLSYANEKGFAVRHWTPDKRTKDMAFAQGREDEYLDLLMLHHFVHGTVFATSLRYTVGSDGTIRVGETDGAEWIGGVVISGGQSGLYAARALCQILGLPEPAEIVDLLHEIDEIAARLDAERG